ncbi:MAG: hypothetical protein PHE78_08070 [Candidatus Gastranaerophilales bacterium]|nr:hypothetical protein [Candidatus Gastranaerophilales bacterium]
MKYIYVKDQDGFVIKKTEKDILSNETIISKKEYDEISGINYYKKTYGRGGKRSGAGRPKSSTTKIPYSVKFEKETDLKIREYARSRKIPISQALREIVKNGLNIAS